MREILKRLSCLSLIAVLSVSGIFINKTNASAEEQKFTYFTWNIDDFEKLSYDGQKKIVNACNVKFKGDFARKYFWVIEPFLDKLGEIKHMIELLKVSYGMILNGDDEPKVSKGQVFNALVANFVLGSSFIKQNPGNLYVRVITALIEGTEFS